MRECYKGYDESQWERGKFDPPPPKNPLTDGHQNYCRWLRREYLPDYHHAKFYPNQFRSFGSAHAWFRAPRHKVTRLFLGSWEKGYSRYARTDFDAKYVKRRGSAQGSAFWGSRNQYLRFRPPFSSKTVFWAPFWRDLEFFCPKTALRLDGSSP